jgi:hypothetical protein
MSERDLLPKGLLWGSDGHASEWVLSALGDGEDSLVPEDVAFHVDTCEVCLGRMVASATLSVSLGDELREVFGERRATVPFPKTLFFGVLGLATLGTLRWFDLRDGSFLDWTHEVFAALRGLRNAIPAFSAQLSGVLFATAALATLVAAVAGITVARKASLSFEKERTR